MPDQATQLRLQIRRHQADLADVCAQAPKFIAVAGGKGGVGTSTVAINTAISLARQGLRMILVDGDMHRADVAQFCHIEPLTTIADVLAGHKTVHEALYPGPGGVQILPGVWSAQTLPDCSPPAHDRLLRDLTAMHRHADAVVIDAGNSPTAVARRFWHAADTILVVTTPDSIALMDAYAAIKVLHAGEGRGALLSVVNSAADAAAARNVYQRLAGACGQFLNLELQSAGWLPRDEALAGNHAARYFDAIAQHLLAACGNTLNFRQRSAA